MRYNQWIVVIQMPSGKQSPAAQKAAKDNHANQCNPNHSEFNGHQPGYAGKGNKADLDNHARQLNPENSVYKAPNAK